MSVFDCLAIINVEKDESGLFFNWDDKYNAFLDHFFCHSPLSTWVMFTKPMIGNRFVSISVVKDGDTKLSAVFTLDDDKIQNDEKNRWNLSDGRKYPFIRFKTNGRGFGISLIEGDKLVVCTAA